MLTAMHETARLAGFFAATLTPLLGYEDAGGDRGLDRFAFNLNFSCRRG
jgi:hypothetical protein